MADPPTSDVLARAECPGTATKFCSWRICCRPGMASHSAHRPTSQQSCMFNISCRTELKENEYGQEKTT